MTNMRLVSVVKYKSKRKDSTDQWIVMRDPVTNTLDPRKIALSGFNQEDFFFDPASNLPVKIFQKYFPQFKDSADSSTDQLFFSWQDFFRTNNKFVELALLLGCEFGEGYDKFLQLGFRASQQISAKLRAITVGNYNRLVEELEAELLSQTVKASTIYRNSKLDEIVSRNSTATAGDKQNIQRMIDSLRDNPVPLKVKDSRGLSYNLEQKVKETVQTVKSSYDALLEYFPKVDDSNKARFLAVVKHAELHNAQRDFFKGGQFLEEVYTVMEGIGVHNSNKYLEILHGFLQNNDFKNFLEWTYEAGLRNLDGLSVEEKQFYFEVFGLTLQKGVKERNVSIADYAASLLYNRTVEEARTIVGSAIQECKSCSEIVNYLYKKKYGKK